MRTLHLIRHGKVALPEGICYGQSDVLLTEPSDVLAKKIKCQLPEEYSLWSSPLSRCRLLAQALGEPGFDTRLMEINFGEWELKSYADIGRKSIDAWAASPFDFKAPGGENVKEMQIRVLMALTAILSSSSMQHIVVVTHAGPARAILGFALQQHFNDWAYRPIAYGELISLNLSDTFLQRLNANFKQD